MQNISLNGQEKDGEGPHVEMWPRAPSHLKTALGL